MGAQLFRGGLGFGFGGCTDLRMATSRADSQLSKSLRGRVYQQKTASRQTKPIGPSLGRVGNTVRSPNKARYDPMTVKTILSICGRAVRATRRNAGARAS
jgi:hypothetical protein